MKSGVFFLVCGYRRTNNNNLIITIYVLYAKKYKTNYNSVCKYYNDVTIFY